MPLKETPPPFTAGVEFDRLSRGFRPDMFNISGKEWISYQVERIQAH